MSLIRVAIALAVVVALAPEDVPPAHASAAVPGVALASATAPPTTWMVLSREDGCMALDVVTRGDRLPRTPVSPDDYAAMMRDRGHRPTVGPPPGFPSDLAGKVVMVQVRPDHAPIFVRDDVCRQMTGK